MKNNGKDNYPYDLFDELETGEPISQEVLDSLQTDNPELFEVLQKSNLLRQSAKVLPDPYFSRVSQIHVYYRLIDSKRPKFTPIQNLKYFFSNLTFSPPKMAFKPVMTILLVLIMSFSVLVGGVQAADNSRPGQILYPLDLALENFQLMVTTNEDARLELQLSFAEERLAEAAAEFQEGQYQNAETALAGYEQVQRSLSAQLIENKDKITEEVQKSTIATSMQHTVILTNLMDSVPETSRQAILRAIQITTVLVEEQLEQPPVVIQQPEEPKVVIEPTSEQGSDNEGQPALQPETETSEPTLLLTPLPTATLQNQFNATVWAFSVNVHSEPRLTSPVVGWLFKNQSITSNQCENGFVYIAEFSGWASGTCFTPNPCGLPGSCLQIQN